MIRWTETTINIVNSELLTLTYGIPAEKYTRSGCECANNAEWHEGEAIRCDAHFINGVQFSYFCPRFTAHTTFNVAGLLAWRPEMSEHDRVIIRLEPDPGDIVIFIADVEKIEQAEGAEQTMEKIFTT